MALTAKQKAAAERLTAWIRNLTQTSGDEGDVHSAEKLVAELAGGEQLDAARISNIKQGKEA